MFATWQRRAIVGLVVLTVLLLIVVAYLLGQRTASPAAAVRSGATVTPPPTPSPTPSPAPVPSPSPVPRMGQPVTGSNAELKAGSGFDSGPGRGSGGSCDAWLDPGWTRSDCGLVLVGGDGPSGSIGYMVERKPAGPATAWRVFLMTNSGEVYWHTKLFAGDDTGTAYTGVVVRKADVTGGGRPDVEVGFRRADGRLVYDVVQKALNALDVVVHRERAGGRVSFAGGRITDYQNTGADWLREMITYTPMGWVVSSSEPVPVSMVPAGDVP